MNYQRYQEQALMAHHIPHAIAAADKDPWMVVQYVPSLGTGGAAATVAVSTAAETITFLVDAASCAGADAIGGASSMITLVGTVDTMGELVDTINAAQAWRAYLVGALRADVPSHLLNFAATSCIGATGKTMYGDSSDAAVIGFAISGEQFLTNGAGGHVKDWDDQCINQLLYLGAKMGDGTGTVTLNIYSGKAGETETLIYSKALTEDTLDQFGEANATEPWIQADAGHRLVIRISTDSAFDAYSVQAIGRTIVQSGSRLVTKNYTAG